MNIALVALLADSWGMHGDDIGIGWMIVMMAAMVVFWGGIIVGIVWLVRGAVGGWPRRRSESPTDVLERRFAEGAISVDDYHERREILLGVARGQRGARHRKPAGEGEQ